MRLFWINISSISSRETITLKLLVLTGPALVMIWTGMCTIDLRRSRHSSLQFSSPQAPRVGLQPLPWARSPTTSGPVLWMLLSPRYQGTKPSLRQGPSLFLHSDDESRQQTCTWRIPFPGGASLPLPWESYDIETGGDPSLHSPKRPIPSRMVSSWDPSPESCFWGPSFSRKSFCTFGCFEVPLLELGFSQRTPW